MLSKDNEFIYTYKKELPDSTAIRRVYYNANVQRLVVVFPTGNMAGYEKVMGFDVANFVNARSVGTHYHAYIKKFPGFDTRGINAFEPHNSSTMLNTSPSVVHFTPPQSSPKPDKPAKKTKYEVSFVLEATTIFEAESDNMVEALEQFLGAHKEKNGVTVRVRSMKEVV